MTRSLVLSALLVSLLGTRVALAFDVGGGVAALDQGDDRIRPASMLDVGYTDQWYSRIYGWGQTLGDYTERSVLLSTGKRGEITSSAKYLKAGLGAALLYDYNARLPEHETSEYKKREKNVFNFGLHTGLAITGKFAGMQVGLIWDANLFLAGSAGLFLVTARRQMIGLKLGFGF